MGVKIPLTIHEIYAALTPSDSRSDWDTVSLLPLLLPLNRQRIITSSNVSVLIKEGVFFTGKSLYLKKIRVPCWPEISALGVFLILITSEVNINK